MGYWSSETSLERKGKEKAKANGKHRVGMQNGRKKIAETRKK